MENLQPHQILVPLAFAIFIGIMVLVWGDRPGLAEAVRGLFRSGDDDAPEPAEDRQPPPPARFEAKHFAPYVAPVGAVPNGAQNSGEPRSDAVEQGSEQSGTGERNRVPALVAQLEQCSDEALLDILARLKTPAGEERFADSRIAKFVGGRVEDRVEQVRAVRAKPTPAPAPQGRAILVRDRGGAGEHLLTLE